MSLRGKLSTIFTLAIAVLAFATFASAQDSTSAPQDGNQKQERRARGDWGKGGHRGMGGRRGMMGELRGIDLSDAQKAQLKAIHEANKPDEGTMQEMKTLIDAKRAGTITPEQTERLKALRQQGREKMEAVRTQVLAILTPEQRQQVEQRREEMKNRRQERRQKWEQNKSADKPTDN
jgi:Spy/CpxP family protein refolding chaperone